MARQLPGNFTGFHPFGSIDVANVRGKAIKEIGRMAKESSILGKELGGIGCYRVQGNAMVIDDFIQVRSDVLGKAHYSYDKEAMRVSSEFHCRNDVPFIFHTHPSGNATPSDQDRLVSTSNQNPGCIVTIGGMKCYAGMKDIVVVPTLFKNHRIEVSLE